MLSSIEKYINDKGVTWLRWVIILAVLGLSGVAYQLAGRLPWMFLVGAVGAFLFALLAFATCPWPSRCSC
jgi:hypothetical protein